MTSLASRIRDLEDEREVLRTLSQYGHALDHGDEEAMLDAFIPDGVWERVNARHPADIKRHAAPDGLRRLVREHPRNVFMKHLLVEPQVALSGDEAEVVSYFVRIQEHPDGPYLYAFGRYRDQLRRCPDGRWRIVLRHAETEATVRRPLPDAGGPG